MYEIKNNLPTFQLFKSVDCLIILRFHLRESVGCLNILRCHHRCHLCYVVYNVVIKRSMLINSKQQRIKSAISGSSKDRSIVCLLWLE